MDYEKIRKLIEDKTDIVDFGNFENGISDEWIQLAQNRLGVIFPPSYVWWLKHYGGGEINGEEIFSIYEMDFDTVVGGDIVYINELNRKNGWNSQKELVIHENDQGESYYLKLDDVDEFGESPVYIDLDKEKYANNFIDFLLKKIDE
ncbi:MAG: SMI1/KNR4 family protein [Flavobacteriales bacterium]|jgi:hypothetical protein|nr:SMI1/KNR4 family protein [Flavobacteriales bacterium]